MISKTDEYLFKKTLDLAKYGEHRVRVGSLAAIKRRPICGAFNTTRNLTCVDYQDRGNHAEMNVLASIPYEKREQVTLYVARLSVGNTIKDSFPCRFCFSELEDAGIKSIVYWGNSQLRKVRL